MKLLSGILIGSILALAACGDEVDKTNTEPEVNNGILGPCGSYCHTDAISCPKQFALDYEDADDCFEKCGALVIGTESEVIGDSVECRRNQLERVLTRDGAGCGGAQYTPTSPCIE